MNCPYCNGATKVTDSRPHKDGCIRRKRKCLECGQKFSTIESLESQFEVGFEAGKWYVYDKLVTILRGR